MGFFKEKRMPEFLKEAEPVRGFKRLEFIDRYGVDCSIQRSSLATEDAIWLGVSEADPRILAREARALGVDTDQDNGWISYPVPQGVSMNTRMHLTRDQVAALLPTLQRFAETGEL
jgi:hypothetical protein